MSRPSSKFSILFDSQWYLSRNSDVATSEIDPLHHYLTYGGREGRDPHPLFNTRWYLRQKPELADIELSPLEHYIILGAHDGRSPHPAFDSQFYTENHPEALGAKITPLEHYLTVGWKLGYRPNRDFDPNFYLNTYHDVAAAKIEPLTHFVWHGQAEGRKRSAEASSFHRYQPNFAIPTRRVFSTPPSVAINVRALAFYLPQFHPIPENDRWWGQGFTDWDNVRTGQPAFSGHYQPHVPAGLGYYDLRDPDVLRKHAELARIHRIYGFCFYYYWFAGKVLLDRPIRKMLESGRVKFPFCLCWANENWTRRWDGLENDILIGQNHSPDDDIGFIRSIEQALLHEDYIRIHEKPLLLVYRPSLFPNPLETTERWRTYFSSKGHGELYLLMVRSFHDQTAPATYGFDAAVQFPPHLPAAPITTWIPERQGAFTGDIYDYIELRKVALEQLTNYSGTDQIYPGVIPSWDNTARRGGSASIWTNSSPEAYYEWLSAAAKNVEQRSGLQERLVFINAWNEWAEGCHLEPDEKHGFGWLNATALALDPTAYSALTLIEPDLNSITLSARNRQRSTSAVLLLTPVHEGLDRRVLDRAKSLARQATARVGSDRIVYDEAGEAPPRGLPHPHRQAAMATLRQKMIERHLRDEQWVFWVDADIIDYPSYLIEELIQRAEGGIAAPLVLMEGNISEPVGKDGFGPGRFYDVAGFVENGRWARFTPPYFDQPGPIYKLDSVGSCYLINADLYRMGAKHAIDPASAKFVDSNRMWPPDAVAKNQQGPANAYTEHYAVCQFAIRHGQPVQAFADLLAYHKRV